MLVQKGLKLPISLQDNQSLTIKIRFLLSALKALVRSIELKKKLMCSFKFLAAFVQIKIMSVVELTSFFLLRAAYRSV